MGERGKRSVYFFGAAAAAAALDTPTEKLLKVYLEIKIFEPARLATRFAALATQRGDERGVA